MGRALEQVLDNALRLSSDTEMSEQLRDGTFESEGLAAPNGPPQWSRRASAQGGCGPCHSYLFCCKPVLDCVTPVIFCIPKCLWALAHCDCKKSCGICFDGCPCAPDCLKCSICEGDININLPNCCPTPECIMKILCFPCTCLLQCIEGQVRCLLEKLCCCCPSCATHGLFCIIPTDLCGCGCAIEGCCGCGPCKMSQANAAYFADLNRISNGEGSIYNTSTVDMER